MEIDYSTISRISRCPRAYEIDKMEVVPFVLSSALYLGRVVHSVYKVYFKSRLAKIELSASDIIDMFNIIWESEKDTQEQPIDWGRDKPDEQAELGRALVKSYYPYAQKLQPAVVEEKFTRNTPYALVKGRIDLITTSGSVIDYKTSARLPYKTEIDRELQPTVYSFLLGGTVDFQYHYILKFKLPVVRIFSTKRYDEELSFFADKLLPSVVKMIETGMFPPLGKGNGACQWCGYKTYCEAI